LDILLAARDAADFVIEPPIPPESP